MLKKVISGGQTGVDRASLDVAIQLNIAYGGWCPRGRKAEDGILDPIKYSNLKETPTDDYSQRTELNVRDSDGTLIIIIGEQNTIGQGTILTINMTKKYQKPLFVVNLDEFDKDTNERKIVEWISNNNIQILNIGGPREETKPGIYQLTKIFLISLLQKIKYQT